MAASTSSGSGLSHRIFKVFRAVAANNKREEVGGAPLAHKKKIPEAEWQAAQQARCHKGCMQILQPQGGLQESKLWQETRLPQMRPRPSLV